MHSLLSELFPNSGVLKDGWWCADRGGDEADAGDDDATAGVMLCTQSIVSQLFPNSGINDVAEAGKGEVDL